jgi:hypothetical protein
MFLRGFGDGDVMEGPVYDPAALAASSGGGGGMDWAGLLSGGLTSLIGGVSSGLSTRIGGGTKPTIVVQPSHGMSTGTKLALGAGALLVVGLVLKARR